MEAVKISETTYSVFGRCLKLESSETELMVTLDFGPRIIHFARAGMENVFYNDESSAPIGKPFEEYGGDVLRLRGGHRLWAAPEINPRCYHPDNEPVRWEPAEQGNAMGATFTAAEERRNGIEKSMTVLMNPDGGVMVCHSIKNTGAWEIMLAPWAITMLAAGGLAVLPMPQSKTGLLPNRSFTFWDYTDLSDERLRLGKEYITLKQETECSGPIKIGYNNEDGWAAYFNRGQMFIKFFESDPAGDYPDGGCTYETYTNNVMLESETLGTMDMLSPGETISHLEEWELHAEPDMPAPGDWEAIGALMSKYI